MIKQSYLLLGCLLLVLTEAVKEYDMSRAQGCGLSGYVDVPSGDSVTLKALPNRNAPSVCSITLRAEDENDALEINFVKQDLLNCNARIKISSSTKSLYDLGCKSKRQKPKKLGVRKITVRIVRPNFSADEYNIRISVTAYRPGESAVKEGGVGNSSGEKKLSTGVIIGIVAGVLVFLVIVVVILLCCQQRRHKKASEDSKAMLKQKDSERIQGLNNSMMKNGNSPQVSMDSKLQNVSAIDLPSSPRSGALLSDFSEKKFVYDGENGRYVAGSGQGKSYGPGVHERSVDEVRIADNSRPILEDFKKNSMFQDSYVENELYQDDRRNRMREPQNEDSPMVAPPLPMAPKSPGVARRNNHAGIRRAPRPTSSAEEIQQLGCSLEEQGDVNIQLIPESPNERGSVGEVVPIRLDTSHDERKNRNQSYLEQEEFEENIPTELSYDDESFQQEGKPKHTLRPNRKRTNKKDMDKPKGTSTQSDNVRMKSDASKGKMKSSDQKQDRSGFSDRRDRETNQSGRSFDERTARERSKSTDARESGRGTKNKGQKSPKLGSLGRRRGGSLGRELDDYPNSRPDSPGSMYSNAPLQRSGSRQSLYASRSSLYNRRRRGSFSESVTTAGNDDRSFYPNSNRSSRRGYPDDDESHFHRGRSYRSSRSMDDLRGSRRYADFDGESNFKRGRRKRSSRSNGDLCDTGTQTLYETGTQTGSGYVNRSGRRNSGRKSPRPKQKQSSGGTKMSVSTEKAATVDSAVGTNDRRKKKSRARVDDQTDSDESVTKIKQKMALELNEAVKKPVPLKKPTTKPRERHPLAEGEPPHGLPSYEDSQKNHHSEQVPFGFRNEPPRSEPGYNNVQKQAYDEQIYDDVYNQGQLYNQGQDHDWVPRDEQIYQNLPRVSANDNRLQSSSGKTPYELLCELTDSDYISHSKHSGSHNYAKSEGSYKAANRGGYANSDAGNRDQMTYDTSRPQNPSGYPQKSSWEQLQQMTDPDYKQQYGRYYETAESNV